MTRTLGRRTQAFPTIIRLLRCLLVGVLEGHHLHNNGAAFLLVSQVYNRGGHHHILELVRLCSRTAFSGRWSGPRGLAGELWCMYVRG